MLQLYGHGLMQAAAQAPPGGGSYDTVVAAIPGVVAFWRLQDASTSLLADSSGNGRHGFYNDSPTLRVDDAWAEGASDGFCVDFAGLGYGEVPHHASFDLAAGTLSLYFRCGSLSNSAYAVTKDVSGLGAGQCTVRVETSGILRTHFQSATDTIIIESSAGAVAPGTWYHYLLTFDGTGFTVRLNNVLIGSQSGYTAGLIGNTLNWLFGRSPFANQNSDIALDEVVLFNRVVTSSERAALAGLEAFSFSPGNLPGSALWLESDQGVLASSGRVSQWSDRLGTNHFVQTTNAQQPFLLSNQITGHPAIDFRGAELLLSTVPSNTTWPVNGGSAAEVWIVFAITSLPSSGQAHLFSINQNSTTNALQIRWLSSELQIAYRTASGLSSFPTTPPALNAYRLVRLRKAAATVTGYLAGTQFGQATDARTDVLTGGVATPLVIGGREGLTNMMNGKVVFAWAGNQLLSTQEAIDLEAYLIAKYGVGVAVPAFERVGSVQTAVQTTRVASWAPITRSIGATAGLNRIHVERIMYAGDNFLSARLNGSDGTIVRLAENTTLNAGVAIAVWNDAALPAAAGNYTLDVTTDAGGTVGHALGDTFQGAAQGSFVSSMAITQNTASISATAIAPTVAGSVYLDGLRTDLNQSVSSKTPVSKAVDLHATGTGGFTNTFHGASLDVSASVTPGYTMSSTAAELELAAIIIQSANP